MKIFFLATVFYLLSGKPDVQLKVDVQEFKYIEECVEYSKTWETLLASKPENVTLLVEGHECITVPLKV